LRVDCFKALDEVVKKGHAEGLHEAGWRLEGWRLADVVMLLWGGMGVVAVRNYKGTTHVL
jgi:hypothetical protein